MIPYLLQRQIGVLMSFAALLIFSVIAIMHLPVSLLPAIDVPQIIVKVNYPNGSPQEIESNVLAPIRDSFATLDHLKVLDSEAASESGVVYLSFGHGTDMKLAYIAANEKVDKLMSHLPPDIERPRVVRINTSDIPVARIQVVPHDVQNMLEVSLLAEKVLKKRLESLEGVSVVDINGLRKSIITISPHETELRAAHLSIGALSHAIRQHNLEMGSLTIKDGQYRYFLKIVHESLHNPASIKSIPIKTDSGKIFTLGQLADVAWNESTGSGYHLFGQKEGIVIAVHKQSKAQMNQLMPLIYESVRQYQTEFPETHFQITQDQSALLDAGIDNLSTSLIFGGIFAFGILFLFLGHFRIPLIIAISIPSSLLISFIFFYGFDLSLNIISLSGLALGLGMLIDNAIIVLDNITQKLIDQKKSVNYKSIFEACVTGVNEVIAPLISSVLTTLAIFVPLIFLNGLAGALFYDQAMAVAATLGASLLVSFVLLPLLYLLFFSGKKTKYDAKWFQNSPLFDWVLIWYDKALHWAFDRKIWVLSFCFLLLLMGWGSTTLLDLKGMPEVEKTDFVCQLDWNTPIDAVENKNRILDLLRQQPDTALISEGDIGNQQFLTGKGDNKVSTSMLYFNLPDTKSRTRLKQWLITYLDYHYPTAQYSLLDASNGFNQLFTSQNPYFEVRLKNKTSQNPLSAERLNAALSSFPATSYRLGKGLDQETTIIMTLNADQLALHQIDHQKVITLMTQLFTQHTITEVKNFGEVLPIKLHMPLKDFEYKVKTSYVESTQVGQTKYFPLKTFINYEYSQDYQSIVADRTGIYHSVVWPYKEDYAKLMSNLRDIENGQDQYTLSFVGEYFQNRDNLRQFYFILLLSLILLYFILAAQFESFVQPLIVILTLPLGIAGSLIVLWLFGGSLNMMSGIGIIIMLGIMVNDAILKIDTMNRLISQKKVIDKESLKSIIFQAGHLRLKPILMTSLTTILALLPVVLSSGLGADLQSPLILTVLGGLTIGTVTALFFIPLSYYYTKSLSI